MKKIGFSHGVLHKIAAINTKAAVQLYKNCGKEIFEACFVKSYQMNNFDEIIPDVKEFSYKSIHLPDDIEYINNLDTKKALNRIVDLYKSIGATLALVHPVVVKDWIVFNGYRVNWAVENMDNLKSGYRGVGEFETFFRERPNWKFVLDINHCYSNDPTMKLAEEFINRLGDKIVEIHLSGYEDYHSPLFKTGQDFLIKYAKKLDVPIVIESVFDDVGDVKKEFDYITEHLNK